LIIFSGQTNNQIDLEHYSNSAEIINNYEIKSNGPSVIEQLTISFYIPIADKVAGSNAIRPIINMTSLKMQATYDSQLLGIDLYDQNNTLLLVDPIEVATTLSGGLERTVITQSHGLSYDIHSSGHVHQTMEVLDTDRVATASMTRRRRDLRALAANREQNARLSNVKAHDLLSEEFKGRLPVNRTIVFNCRDPETTICVRSARDTRRIPRTTSRRT